MDSFTETLTVAASEPGFVALAVRRQYDDGIVYSSTLYFQIADLPALADAFERFAATGIGETLTLADGSLRIFGIEPSPMVNCEIQRRAELAHGGYDTLDFGPGSVADLIAQLRAAATG